MKVWTVRYAGSCKLIGIYDSYTKANRIREEVIEGWKEFMGCDVTIYIEEHEVNQKETDILCTEKENS